jgi:hypothetical protein
MLYASYLSRFSSIYSIFPHPSIFYIILYPLWGPLVTLSKYIHVTSCFEVFIETNLMVQSKFNLVLWFASYNIFMLVEAVGPAACHLSLPGFPPRALHALWQAGPMPDVVHSGRFRTSSACAGWEPVRNFSGQDTCSHCSFFYANWSCTAIADGDSGSGADRLNNRSVVHGNRCARIHWT